MNTQSVHEGPAVIRSVSVVCVVYSRNQTNVNVFALPSFQVNRDTTPALVRNDFANLLVINFMPFGVAYLSNNNCYFVLVVFRVDVINVEGECGRNGVFEADFARRSNTLVIDVTFLSEETIVAVA